MFEVDEQALEEVGHNSVAAGVALKVEQENSEIESQAEVPSEVVLEAVVEPENISMQ